MRTWLRSHFRAFLCLIIGASLLYYSAFINSSSNDVDSFMQNKRMRILAKRSSEEPIYIVGAYLIREDYLRIILITDCRTKNKLFASFFDSEKIVKVLAKNITAMTEGCLTNACKYDGMYAEFEFPAKVIGDYIVLDVDDTNNQSSSAMVRIQRSVPPTERKHRLAVCLPALFYYSDTIQLIEFIENWLLTGATKFYVYWQAITPAIKKVLLFYQASGVDLEMVAFPHLYNETLDVLVYYTGQLISINDCLHKARSEAEFAAAVDLDELMVVVANSTNLITLLNDTLITSAGRSLSRAHAHFDKQPVYSSEAQQLSFAPLGEIHSDKPGSAFDKLILRPENVRRSFVHWITELEPQKVGLFSLPSSKAMLVHLRSFKEKVDETKYRTSNILETISRNMTANWSFRLTTVKNELNGVRITQSIPDMAQTMESCLLRLKADSRCFTASHCVPLLKTNTTTVVDWQYPEREWIEI